MKSVVLILVLVLLVLDVHSDSEPECNEYADLIQQCYRTEYQDCCYKTTKAIIDGCVCSIEGRRDILLEACTLSPGIAKDCPAPGPAPEMYDPKIRSWLNKKAE